MTTQLETSSATVHERVISEAEGEQLIDAFDNGFEAGQDDLNNAPLVTPNPHAPRTAAYYVWALGYEHGNL